MPGISHICVMGFGSRAILRGGGDEVIVAIPVKNEESRIGACLDALARQSVAPGRILLLLNNCSDRTGHIVGAAAARDERICVIERDLHGAQASAGEARRLVLEAALEMAGTRGVIITSDADCEAAPDWVGENLREIGRGADVVCGAARVMAVAGNAAPGQLPFDLAREAMYAALLDEIAALVDPDPADPWPRHQQDSGASIAMKAAILGKVGGAPLVPVGEDRALVERFRLFDARIRHAPGLEIAVSGRWDGRAAGGMADALGRRAAKPDEETDAALEPAVDAFRRVVARRRLRGMRDGAIDGAMLARDLLVGPDVMAAALACRMFGAAWAAVEAASPVLRRRRVKFVGLAGETRQAIALRDQMRLTADALAPLQQSGGLRVG